MFFNKILLLALTHLLQLKVPRVSIWPESPSLHDDEEDCSDHRDEVEWEIHKVTNDSCGGEFGKGLFRQFPQAGDGVTTGIYLTAFGHHFGHVLGNEGLSMIS